jgi:hypothetical protein
VRQSPASKYVKMENKKATELEARIQQTENAYIVP